ncbi:hypothetical protein HYX19_01395, partial [Candidatus Woesearchaeota archaeon]|nr:hypothetical protein [Candidatus Woesearchaeota archaeon]
TITMTVYFSQWLVVDKKVSDFWFSLAFVVPIHESSTFFGLYTFAERFASVVGPLVWGILIFLFKDNFPTNYRIAAFTMGLLVLLGVIPLILKERKFSKIEAGKF